MLFFRKREDISMEEQDYSRYLSVLALEGPIFEEPEDEFEPEAQYED